MHKKVTRFICLFIIAIYGLNAVYAGITKNLNMPGQSSDLLENYGVYQISDNESSNCLEVSGDIFYNEKYKDGREIVLHKTQSYKNEPAGWQQWYIIYHSTVNGNKYYYIRNVFSGKLLSTTFNKKQNKHFIEQMSQSDSLSDSQLWSIRKSKTDEQFYIINKKNGLALSRPSATANLDSVSLNLVNLKYSQTQSWSLIQKPLVAYRDDNVVKFFERNNKSLGSVAFDEGMSIPLYNGANKGKVLWVTQDAWDGHALLPNNKFDCNSVFEYRNSIIIQPSLTDWNPDHTKNMIREGSLQHHPKQICDVVPNTEFAWPAAGVEINDHVYIQCFEGDGLGPAKSQSLYDLTESAGNLWQVKRTTPKGMSTETKINYYTGMVKANDGYVYVFGTKSTGYGYSLNLHVARFPVTNPQEWKYWNGSLWANDPVSDDSARIADGLSSSSVSFVNNKYVLITMDQGFNCDSTRNIYVSVADNPTGPFTKRKKIYSISEFIYGQYARYYTSAIHPEFDNGHDELLVTYCLNYSACDDKNNCKEGYLDPYYYRVKGIRIPYSEIGL